MTEILIIEDEIPAREKLKRFITSLEVPTRIVAEVDTVEAAIAYLKHHRPHLIFSDIELKDGNAFEIFSQVSISCPVIFTTAYDSFWMEAFEGNGIAYLLKPFSRERFQKAWDKYQLLGLNTLAGQDAIAQLTRMLHQNHVTHSFKKRFTILSSGGTYFIDTEDILFFQASEGVVFAHDVKGKRHMLTEPTLKQIEEAVNPDDFFRLNRSEVIQKRFVIKIDRYSKNALAVYLKGLQKPLVTSQRHTAAFRQWVER